ncbi:hypothetical protein CcI49_12125 [Frankia sp. CcI49]|uniref:hypothetical protein n=1 Tax=Frankia sp. CcI49 TaxID=1745382 RepID=UPI0009771480|nr:hypothetical protein [Frankia sp. CcI49]ONH60142.1 hypothetical protein CcI49_12125 [Frankia sp. CcI49]
MSSPGSAADPHPIHQIVYHWVPGRQSPLGQEGVGPALTSLEDLRRLASWNTRLLSTVLAASGQGPDGSLCYLRFGPDEAEGEAAVIRRVPALDPQGRVSVLAHALVGPEHLLPPRLALALRAWPRWFGAGWHGGLGPAAGQVDAVRLRRPTSAAGLRTPDVETSLRGLGVAARELDEPLVQLVAGVLADPAGQVSAVGYPGRVDPLMFGLIEVLDDLLGGLPGHDWSFSTAETAERRSPLRHIFLDRTSHSDFEQTRLRVRYGSALPPEDFGAAAEVAVELVEAYREYGPGGMTRVARALADPLPDSLPAVAPWVVRAASAPMAASGHLWSLRRVLQGRGGESDSAEIGRPETAALLRDEIRRLRADGFGWLRSGWRMGTAPVLVASAEPVWAILGERLVEAVLDESLAAASDDVPSAAGAGDGPDPGVGDLDRNVERAIQRAVSECGLGPAAVRTVVERWWEQIGASEPGAAGRLRAAQTAIRIWAEAGHPDRDRPWAGNHPPAGLPDPVQRRELGVVLALVLAGVPLGRVAEQLPTGTDAATLATTLAVTLHVLNNRLGHGGDARVIADSVLEPARARGQIRRHLVGPKLDPLWAEPAQLPEPALPESALLPESAQLSGSVLLPEPVVERRLMVDLLFRPELEDPRTDNGWQFAEELRGLLQHGLPPGLVAELLTVARDAASSPPAEPVLSAFVVDQWLARLGHPPLTPRQRQPRRPAPPRSARAIRPAAPSRPMPPAVHAPPARKAATAPPPAGGLAGRRAPGQQRRIPQAPDPLDQMRAEDAERRRSWLIFWLCMAGATVLVIAIFLPLLT